MSSLEATLDKVERLASSGARADLSALVRLLGDDDWQTRRAAAEAIAQAICASPQELDSESLFEELIAAVCDKTAAGKRAAAIAALEGIGPRALPRLAAELRTAPASARIALAGVVGNAGGPDAVQLLAPLAHDLDINVAAAAITALGRTRQPEAAEILMERSDAQDDWLRFAAVGALGELGDARVIEKIELLLEEDLTQEAAAAALAEIGTIEAATALARHLRAPEGALRTAVLAALVSLGHEERAIPITAATALQNAARRLFLEASDESTYSDLSRLMATGEHGRAQACLTGLGWLGDARAIPIVARALDDPSRIKTARRALLDLTAQPSALNAMLANDAIPPAELAAALGGANSLMVIEAAARLSIEATDTETLESSLAALTKGREWLGMQGDGALKDDDVSRLAENLRRSLQAAEGRTLVEIADTLGAVVRMLRPVGIEALLEQLSRSEAEDYVLARLALLFRADAGRAIEEALHAQRHSSAKVRMTAIEILSRRAGTAPAVSLVQHLTDEAASVRRAATRAMRYGAPTDEACRMLLACLVDTDIWVRAEAITTFGRLFGNRPETRASLREMLSAMHPLCRVAACEALAAHAEPRDWAALSRVARRDAQPEVRRAAVQTFVACPQPRTALTLARHALGDTEWSVRRAAIDVIGKGQDSPSLKLLIKAVLDQKEHAAVRGGALRALAGHDAPETIELACLALRDPDETLVEDAYAALVTLARTQRKKMLKATKECAPRAANVINFVLNHDKQ